LARQGEAWIAELLGQTGGKEWLAGLVGVDWLEPGWKGLDCWLGSDSVGSVRWIGSAWAGLAWLTGLCRHGTS